MRAPVFDKKFLAPRYWPVWLIIGFIWLLAQLPWTLQRHLGASLGWLVYQGLRQRVDDTRTNLRLCFPEKTDTEREAMVRDVFHQAGLTIFETANAWFRPLEYYRQRVHIQGLEHLQALHAGGKNTLMLGAHYSMLDLGGALLSLHSKVTTVYRPQKNPVLNYIMVRQRMRTGNGMIAHEDMRGLIRALKHTETVWYATDQDYGLRHAVFAPFFGVPAATITTPSRMARINNAALILIHFHRLGDSERYCIRLTPALENFPSGDDVADATRLNAELEKLIRISPTQYMWYHRRFKTQAPGATSPYPPKRKFVKRAKAAARQAGQS